MHEACAVGTKTRKRPELRAIGTELRLIEGRRFRLLAMEAEHAAGAAGLLAPVRALFEELDDVDAAEDRGIDAFHGLETVAAPVADSGRRRPCRLGRLADIIGAQALDAPRGVPAIRHPLAAQTLDEGADVLDPPRRRLGTELDGRREAAIAHALPPSRAADRDRAVRRDDRAKTKESGSGEIRGVGHDQLHPVKGEAGLARSSALMAEFGFNRTEFVLAGAYSASFGGRSSAPALNHLRIVSSSSGTPASVRSFAISDAFALREDFGSYP
jgi:hypothetical protein